MDNSGLAIETSELRAAFGALIDRLEANYGPSVQVPVDYFWSIGSLDLYDMHKEPMLAVGQVTEAWDNLARERSGTEASLSYSLVWLGEVLTALGHTLVP